MAREPSDLEADPDILIDPEECAERAGLVYVSDQEPGVMRKRWGRGFTYLTPGGEHVQERETRERFENLVIPPAWKEVWISLDPNAHLQVTGRDAEGRKQYIYHPEWERARNSIKFSRTVAFGRMLADLRKRCEREMRSEVLSREKVLAAVIFLLDKTLIRIGNQAYAERNDSFGLTTLRDRHVEFADTSCTFTFTGKSGKEQHVRLDDQRLARVVRRCRDVPGYELFQYYGDDGQRGTIDSSDVNDFLKSVTGENFSAKDFRTWGASVHAAVHLHSLEMPETEKESEKQIVEMIKQVAEELGNTPAVCRDYYIHPHIIEAHRAGSFKEIFGARLKETRSGYLDRREKALLHFFDEWSGAVEE